MKKTKNNLENYSEKWYDRFSKKKTPKVKQEKSKVITRSNLETESFFSKCKKDFDSSNKNYEKKRKPLFIGKILMSQSMFSAEKLPSDAVKILKNFSEIVQSVRPLNSRQLAKLPLEIRNLSHELTDERSERKRSYMNETIRLTSYIRYYMWWNLIRLTRLFSNLPENSFFLNSGDVCLDAGSGPLTFVTALWLARPELRSKNLTWYCLDISQTALSLGEEIFLAVAARTLTDIQATPWKIIRVKGELGTFIKQKVNFIASANMFNELLQHTDMPPEYSAKKYCESLLNYAADKFSVFLVEPGVPKFARLLALMRDFFLRHEMNIISPCPHSVECPMPGKHGGKWCNFAFSTDDAPEKLLKLSKSAELPKERAVLSYIFVTNQEKNICDKKDICLRITSDVIKLPGKEEGFYACSEKGLVLAVNKGSKTFSSGDELEIERNILEKSNSIDEKSGAIKINLMHSGAETGKC